MKNLKLVTILIIILLILLTIFTVCIFLKNLNIVREAFFGGGKHNCYPYTAVLNARLSYSSPSKGWCTTGDYPSLESEGELSDSEKSSSCGPNNDYYRIKGEESIKLDSKSWCKSAK